MVYVSHSHSVHGCNKGSEKSCINFIPLHLSKFFLTCVITIFFPFDKLLWSFQESHFETYYLNQYPITNTHNVHSIVEDYVRLGSTEPQTETIVNMCVCVHLYKELCL